MLCLNISNYYCKRVGLVIRFGYVVFQNYSTLLIHKCPKQETSLSNY